MTGSVFMNTQRLYQRRRAFNMSYRNDLMCNMGEVIPVYWQDLIPNTTWSVRVHGLVRTMPIVAPVLTNFDLYLHFWLSPDRTLYGEEFTKVITGELESEDWPGIYWTPEGVLEKLDDLISEDDPDKQDKIDYLTLDGSIFDLLGYDKSLMSGDIDAKLNGRKFLMYIRLMHDWYANENVEPWSGFLSNFDWKTMIVDTLDSFDGDMSRIVATFVYKCFITWKTAGYMAHQWPKDYYTSALPTLQYGLPTYLPLADSAPVNPNPNNPAPISIIGTGQTGSTGYPEFILENDQLSGHLPAELNNSNGLASVQTILRNEDGASVESIDGRIIPVSGATGNSPFIADLTEATAITINELRIANALQVFKEREMRYGRKAQEYYRGFYGVTPGDLRLQMPKFLGGGRMPVNISDIEQTSETTSKSALGTLAGKGTGLAAGFAKASCFAPEESFVLGVAWFMPKVLYSQALSRHDTKLNDRFDYYNPSFAHIGEQPVYRYEVYAGSFGSAVGNQEFGYQPRYTEYRFHNSEIHGEFKNSLSYWTLARIFDSTPALNANFIYMQPEVLNRIFAVQTTTKGFIVRNMIVALQFNCGVIQPLSRYGTPGLMP